MLRVVIRFPNLLRYIDDNVFYNVFDSYIRIENFYFPNFIIRNEVREAAGISNDDDHTYEKQDHEKMRTPSTKKTPGANNNKNKEEKQDDSQESPTGRVHFSDELEQQQQKMKKLSDVVWSGLTIG